MIVITGTLPILRRTKADGILEQVWLEEREQGDGRYRDQLRADGKEDKVQLGAHHAAGGCIDDAYHCDDGDDEMATIGLRSVGVNVADTSPGSVGRTTRRR